MDTEEIRKRMELGMRILKDNLEDALKEAGYDGVSPGYFVPQTGQLVWWQIKDSAHQSSTPDLPAKQPAT